MKRNDYRYCRKNTGRHNHNRRRNDSYNREYDEKLYRKYGIIF